VSFSVLFVCICVLYCTVLLPPGGYPIAVKYIYIYIIYHIVYYEANSCFSQFLRKHLKIVEGIGIRLNKICNNTHMLASDVP
jgi:hypothetical protein